MEKSGNNARLTIKAYQQYLGKIEKEVAKFRRSSSDDTSKIEAMVINLTNSIEESKKLRKSGKGRVSFSLFPQAKEKRLNNITKRAIELLQSIKPESSEAEAAAALGGEWDSVERPSLKTSFEHQKSLLLEYKARFGKSKESNPTPELQAQVDKLKESITSLRKTLYDKEALATSEEKLEIELLLQEIIVTFGSHLEDLTLRKTD